MGHVEGGGENLRGILVQTPEQLPGGARHPGRRVTQPLPVGVLADSQEELAHRGLGPDDVDATF